MKGRGEKMANQKLTDKKTLSVIVIFAVAILIGTIIHIDIIYGRPKHPSTIPYWIFSYTTYVGFNLAILTYWLKIGRKKETEEKFSVKKILAIIVLTVLVSLPCCGFFFIAVLIVSAMTGNFVLAFIVGLLPTLTILAGLSISMFNKKKGKVGENVNV